MLPDVGPDLACTLEGDDTTARLAEWRAITGQATARSTIDDGIRLTYSSLTGP